MLRNRNLPQQRLRVKGLKEATDSPADKYKHLSIREVEQAIAKLLHDVTLAQDKAREAAPPINKPRMAQGGDG